MGGIVERPHIKEALYVYVVESGLALSLASLEEKGVFLTCLNLISCPSTLQMLLLFLSRPAKGFITYLILRNSVSTFSNKAIFWSQNYLQYSTIFSQLLFLNCNIYCWSLVKCSSTLIPSLLPHYHMLPGYLLELSHPRYLFLAHPVQLSYVNILTSATISSNSGSSASYVAWVFSVSFVAAVPF